LHIVADASIGDLDIIEDLEIFGAGPALTVIKWENQSQTDPTIGDRIFHIQAEPLTTVNLVRIADLTIMDGSVGIPNTIDPEDPYNCEVTGEPGSIEAWQFKRVGGGIAAGPGAAVFFFAEQEHGPGTEPGGKGGPPVDPGGDEVPAIAQLEQAALQFQRLINIFKSKTTYIISEQKLFRKR
jgi:hypothetical protein